jgi:hypothetical protein
MAEEDKSMPNMEARIADLRRIADNLDDFATVKPDRDATILRSHADFLDALIDILT